MSGSRSALIVASDAYDDPGLSELQATARDATMLADVLRDPARGGFDVQVLQNESAHLVCETIEEFFQDRSPGDLLVLHFSCHGVKNADGALFLAMPDTKLRRLTTTSVPAAFVSQMMSGSRAQRIALFLDCCFGGAFPRGMVMKAGTQAVARDAFAAELEVPDGRGSVVVTASDAMEYSFIGGTLSDHNEAPSVFTGALVDGLSTGAADRDGDGWVGINELFGYVTEKVRAVTPHQRPQIWTFGVQGDIRLARSRPPQVRATPLEPELAQALASHLPDTRYGLVVLLRERLAGSDKGRALAAWQGLSSLLGDIEGRVADAAAEALDAAALRVWPPSLELTVDDTGTASADVELVGPPLALVATPRTETPWLRISQPDDRRLHLVASPPPEEPGVHTSVVRLRTPIGVHDIPVEVTVPKAGVVRWQLVAFVAAGLAVVLAVAGAVRWLGRDEGIAALPTGPELPPSAVLWVQQEQEEGSASIAYATTAGQRATPLLSSDSRIGYPVLLSSRKTVLYVAGPKTGQGTETGSTLHAVGTDGRGDVLFPVSASACDIPGRPSVNADRIALTCFNAEGRERGIHIIDDHGNETGTVDDRGYDGNPTWTPNGKYLLFWQAETPSETAPRHLFATAANGKGPLIQLTTFGSDTRPAVSPAGNRLVFHRVTPGGVTQLVVMDFDQNNPGPAPRSSPPESLDGIPAEQKPEDPGWTIDGGVIYTSVDGSAWVVDPEQDAAPTELWADATKGDAWMLFGADR